MDLSIVITTRDRKENLLLCVESIKKADLTGISWELIIVDDKSTDGTEKLVGADFGTVDVGIKVIHNDAQKMMVKSRNIGARESTGKYILFIDDDNEVDSNMIKCLIAFAEKNKDYGFTGPSNYFFHSKRKYMDYQKICLYTGRTRGFVSDEGKEVYDSDGIPNVFMIGREVFDKCGYFDESLIQTFTEPDFAAEIKKIGYRCGVVPKAKTFHKVTKEDYLKLRSLGGNFNQKAYCLMRNRTVYVTRYGNILNKLVYILVFSLFWPVVYSLLAMKGKRIELVGLYWNGFVDGLYYFFTGKIRNSLFKEFKN